MKSGMCLASRAFSLDACFICMRIGVASCRVGQGGWARSGRSGHLPSSPSRPWLQSSPNITDDVLFKASYISSFQVSYWLSLQHSLHNKLDCVESQFAWAWKPCREKVSEVFVPFTHFQKSVSAGKRPVWLRTQRWTNWAWAAATPWQMAAATLTWQPQNAWLNVSSTWMGSGNLMLPATSARSELSELSHVQQCLNTVLLYSSNHQPL